MNTGRFVSMRNPSPLAHLVNKDPASLGKALAQGISNAEGLEETPAAAGSREGVPIRYAGEVFKSGPPGGTFGAFVAQGPGLKQAKTFVDQLEGGPFSLMAPNDGGVA